MKIKDAEIISISDLKKGDASKKHRPRRFSQPASFRNGGVYDWRPQKYSGIYSDSLGDYRLFCNFLKDKGVIILNRKAQDILNLCNGKKNIKDILETLSFKNKGRGFKFSDARKLGKEGISFKEFYNKLRFGKEILTLDDLTRILFLFKKNGLILDFKSSQPLKPESSLPYQKFLSVYFYLTDKSYFSPPSFNESLKLISQKEGFWAIDWLFNLAIEHNYHFISIKIFLEKPEELPLLEELVAYCRRKSMKSYIETRFSLFTGWALINSNSLRSFRQMRINLILPLEGTRTTYDRQLRFFKREINFKEVEKALDISYKEKCSPTIINTITSLNLDGLEELTYYLLNRRLRFIFGFIQKHSLVPQHLFPDEEKLIETLLMVYKVIEKELPARSLFQNILGRGFSLFAKHKKDVSRQVIVYNRREKLEIKEAEFKLKLKEKCLKCQFKELCFKSHPVITGCFHFESDCLEDYCRAYRVLIPQALKLEARRLIKYKIN